METVRAFYEYPPSHANMPARDYGGSVTPAKARRSWGDLLKFRSRPKEQQLSPASSGLPQAPLPAPVAHNYLAEYRQKYGGYGGTVGRSYQALRVIQGTPPPPGLTSASPLNSHATKTTMSSTVRYTDWFGSVAGRRPPVRPPLPAFSGVPPPGLHAPEKSAAWDHYVTLDPVYEAPRVMPVQLYTNVCVCPDQLMNTRGKKKKKCKKCGRKVATVRHATAGVVAKVRPAIPTNLYQPPIATRPPAAAPRAWGWQVLEEQVYERFEVQSRRNILPPAHTHSEEESPATTPETVRSVKSIRSTKSGRSNDSSVTITRDAVEPSRPAPPPPRVPSTTPDDRNIVTNSVSAKENSSSGESDDRRSILTENPTAYQLLSSFGNPACYPNSSDPDELSDNAVDTSWDAQPTTPDKISQAGRVSVITVGASHTQGDPPSWEVTDKGVNKVKIYTNSTDTVFGTGAKNSSERFEADISSDSRNESVGAKITLPTASNGRNALSSKTSNSLATLSSPGGYDIPLCNGKHSSSPTSKVGSRIKNNSTKKTQNSVTKSGNPERKNGLINNHSSVLVNGNKKNPLQDGKNAAVNGRGSPAGVSSTSNGPRLEIKKLREASELQQGGNTVRIAGQRMLVLTPGVPSPEPRSEFSSGEDDNDISVEDDTSDYPLSSPTRGSDSDALPEEEDLPLDSSDLLYSYSDPNLDSAISSLSSSTAVSDQWTGARDIIYEEEETEEADILTNGNRDEAAENYGDSSLLGDEEQSANSSSASSPVRHEGLHPTLSELLKVKSILKKPPSVDTSSETDSDFYLPTFSEFKQNQRKKKQVQFRASHDITVIEDAGESKGRKVSSARSQREKEKEKWKNNYNLFSDLQDIYARNNISKVYKPHTGDNFVSSENEKNEHNATGECEVSPGNKVNTSQRSEQSHHKTEEEDRENGQLDPDMSPLDSINSVSQESNEKDAWSEYLEQENCNGTADSHQWSRLHQSLSEHQTSSETLSNLQDTANHHSQHHNHTVTTTANAPLSSSIPTRQAPPPPRSRTLSPPRPSVPPPPPPTVRPAASCVSPSRASPRERPLPSPPPLPSRPPPESPPPSPPPPLPTSPPPPLDDTDRITIITSLAQDSSQAQNPTFLSFKASDTSLYPATNSISSLLHGSSTETPHSKGELREVLPPAGHIPMFGANEETRTATIRGRGAGHARPSFLGTFVSGVPPNTASQSSPPQAPRRRNRNCSQSPEAHDGASVNSTHHQEMHGSQIFFQKGIREEDPYEQITDHIYEELLSRSPPVASPFTSHGSPTRESTQLKSPIPGKSMFEGASKDEILEYLQDARRRVANTVDEDEEREQDLVGNPLEAEVDLEDDEEEDQLGVEPPEDQFTALTSRNRGNRSSNMSSNSDSSENSGLLRSDKERLLRGEVERTDSGVGSETSKPSLPLRHGQQGTRATDGATAIPEGGDLPLCDDCDSPVDTRVTNSGVVYAPLVCRRCSRRRGERKEILTEIMETEIKYGQDLRVMIDQFYRPILVAGLLSREQLKGIFLNVEELLEHNRVFSLQLRDALEIALDQGDEDLLTVNMARLFLHAAPMLHAFETYCIRQGSASLLLQQLEKEKELLRIFLKVSQMENTLLRRMNLHSFLMVPVQRVTKYPLLLARLYKATPPTHASREDCRKAKEKIELHLQHMNNETKEVSPTKLWRRISMSVGSGTPMKRSSQSHNFSTNLRLRKLALQVLDWSPEEATVVREGRLFCLAPDSNNWTRRGRSLKMMTVHILLVTHGTPRALFEEEVAEDSLVMPCNLGIKDAAMLAFKDLKVSKTALVRQEPWFLSRCVVAWEGESETECFEVSDLNSKDTFIFKGSDPASTESWFRYIQFHALSVGTWKRRRPALANIMINGMGRC